MNPNLSGKTPCPVCAFNAIGTTPRLALDTHLLVSNDPPVFTDAFTLKCNLLDLRSALSQVTSTISQAEAVVVRMKAQQDDLRSAIHDLEIVLDPVRSLPQDILATIFERCMTLSEDPIVADEEYESLGPMNPIWTLSFVCRRWRDIILSSPRMWSFVCLPMLDYKGIPLARILSRLGLQIQRSGNVEMDVALFDTPENDKHHPSSCVLPLLYPTTRRWHSFHIKGFYSTFDSFMGYSFDKITRLTIAIHDDQARSMDRVIACFRHAPHIQYVDTDHGNVELLWDGVASYDCNSTGLVNIPKMVSSLRNLTFWGGDGTSWELGVPLVLPTLTRLAFDTLSPCITYTFPTDMLETPALHTLRLNLADSITLSRFPKFLQSPPCLKNVSISILCGTVTRVAELITFFEMTVHVTTLFLNDLAVSAELLAALHLIDKPEETPPLLPQLKTLRFESWTITRYWDSVLALLDSRPAIEEFQVYGDFDRYSLSMWDDEKADRWRDFCSRKRVRHVFGHHF